MQPFDTINQNPAVRLIYGYYMETRELLGLRTVPLEGVVATVRQGEVTTIFSGEIVTDHLTCRVQGRMQDMYGVAELSGIFMSDERLTFTKLYSGRNDPINYKYRKVGDFYEGTYSYQGGSGPTRCFLVDVPDNFFEPLELRPTGPRKDEG